MKPVCTVVIKAADEIELMRRAGRLAARAIHEVARAVVPGATTQELDRTAETLIRDGGGVPSFKDYRGYPASSCTSVDDVVVHGIPGPRVLEEGSIVSIDLGVFLDGFHADTALTVPVGEVKPEVRRLLAVTGRALEAGVAAARPGGFLGDIGWAVQSVAEASGFSVVRDYAGHGIGRELHEDPQVPNAGRPGTGLALRPGMTLAIEPMVNAGGPGVTLDADGWTVRTLDRAWSAHAEHTVVITADGPEILTRLEDAGTLY